MSDLEEVAKIIQDNADWMFRRRALSAYGPRGVGYYSHSGELLYQAELNEEDKTSSFSEPVYKIPFGFHEIDVLLKMLEEQESDK